MLNDDDPYALIKSAIKDNDDFAAELEARAMFHEKAAADNRRRAGEHRRNSSVLTAHLAASIESDKDVR
jgi:hypothetical protein